MKNSQSAMLSGPRDMFAAAGRLLRREAWLLALILAGLVGAEFGLRAVRPDLSNLIYAEDVTGGHQVVLSQDGYRIPADSGPALGAGSLLALGDSTTFGTGVAAETTWPLQMPDLLDAGGITRNAGLEGGSVTLIAHGFDEIWSRPDPPRFALLLVTPNMISFTDFHRNSDLTDLRARARRLAVIRDTEPDFKRQVRDIVQSSPLWKSVNDGLNSFKYAIGLQDHRVNADRPLSPLMAYGWVQPGLDDAHFSRMWTLFETSLADLQSRAEARGTCLVLGFLPPRFMISDHWRDNMKFVAKDRFRDDPEARLGAIAAKLGMRVAPVAEALRAARAQAGPGDLPLYIPGDYTHLDAAGHRITAVAFAETIAPVVEHGQACLVTD